MLNETHEGKTAQILPFQRQAPRKPKGRGRPRSALIGVDLGTPELIMKRVQGQTAEILDLCLERGLITAQQHWCGVHLRWLYTLRHGAPSLRALDPNHLGGHSPKCDDPDWRLNREQEYREAMQALALSGQVPLVMNVCVYNERPLFLTASRGRLQIIRANEALTGLIDGLEILVKLWGRGSRKK
jgi:hypothetical protein